MYVLKWSLPSKRAQYLKAMKESEPVLVGNRKEALVFATAHAARMHPANMVRGCGFEPVPVRA